MHQCIFTQIYAHGFVDTEPMNSIGGLNPSRLADPTAVPEAVASTLPVAVAVRIGSAQMQNYLYAHAHIVADTCAHPSGHA